MMARVSGPTPSPHIAREPDRRVDSLKIASLNVNSLIKQQKRAALLDFVIEHDLNIALIGETKLRGVHVLTFSDYELFRSDRPGSLNGGGTAVLIKNTLPYELVSAPSSANDKILEHTIVRIKFPDGNLFVIAIYANNDSGQHFVDELNTLIRKLNLHRKDNFYLIAGNFNARHEAWRDVVNKLKGVLLKRWYDSEGLETKARIIPPSRPTFPSAGSFLDLCLVDNRVKFLDLVDGKLPVVSYPSDHDAVVFTIALATALATRDPTLSHRFVFKKTRWSLFERNLARHYDGSVPEDRNLTNPEITEHLVRIQSAICEGVERDVPRYKPTDNVLNYVNRRTKSLHKDKAFLVTRLNWLLRHNTGSTRDTTRKRETRLLISTVNDQLNAEFQASQNKYWSTQHKSINHRHAPSFFPKIN